MLCISGNYPCVFQPGSIGIEKFNRPPTRSRGGGRIDGQILDAIADSVFIRVGSGPESSRIPGSPPVIHHQGRRNGYLISDDGSDDVGLKLISLSAPLARTA